MPKDILKLLNMRFLKIINKYKIIFLIRNNVFVECHL